MSLHVRRWIEECQTLDSLSVFLFSTQSYTRHPLPNRLYAAQVRYFLKESKFSWEIGAQTESVNEVDQLLNLIETFKPDLIHSFVVQGASQLVLHAKKRSLRRGRLKGEFPRWITTSMGSDLCFFGRRPEFSEVIKSVMRSSQFHLGECPRDPVLARSFGFRGTFLDLLPACGGFNLADLREIKERGPLHRDLILVKGYAGALGRGRVGIEALAKVRNRIGKLRIAVFGANHALAGHARKLGLNADFLPWVSHREHLARMATARIYLGLSLSDGISISCLEAMAMGAFPIQSNSACTEAWFNHGEGGFRVDPEDVTEVAIALERALTDEHLVASGTAINERAILPLDHIRIRKRIESAYAYAANAKRIPEASFFSDPL